MRTDCGVPSPRLAWTHSPRAYALIDEQLASIPRDEWDFNFVEHESGPELLVIASGLGLATSVINFVVAIINARRAGVVRGNGPGDAVELIVRRVESEDPLLEETVVRINNHEAVDQEQIKALLEPAIKRLSSGAAEKDR